MKNIKSLLKPYIYPLYGPIKNFVKDRRSSSRLKAAKNAGRKNTGPVRVGFIVFEPESWDKLEPVFEEMLGDNRFETDLLVVPSYDNDLSIGAQYGYEWEFFSKKYNNAVKVYDENHQVIDLKRRSYDFVFYQDPYDDHYPREIQSDRVVSYSKICYIPYGYTTLQNFSELLKLNRRFFRNVFAYFPDTESNGEIIKEMFRKNVDNGIQHVLHLGYPSLEKYLEAPRKAELTNITWTPRWSYDKKVGGSHFLEYKDDFLSLDPVYSLCIRPHPMLFANIVSTGMMTEEELDDFKKKAQNRNVIIDDHGPLDAVIEKTGVLITDISSVIPAFFLTGKPIIYCDSHLEPNDEFNEMLEGIYIADSWDEVLIYLKNIMANNDYLQDTRMRIINQFREIHLNSTQRIIDYIASIRN